MRSKTGISISVIPMSVVNVKRSFDKLATDTQKRIARVIAEAGLTIQKDAKTNAPVDFGILRASIYFDYRGGVRDTRQGISSRSTKTGRIRTQPINIPRKNAESNKEGLNALVGSTLDYANKQDVRTGFLDNAYKKTKPKIKPAIERQINEAIKKTVGL